MSQYYKIASKHVDKYNAYIARIAANRNLQDIETAENVLNMCYTRTTDSLYFI